MKKTHQSKKITITYYISDTTNGRKSGKLVNTKYASDAKHTCMYNLSKTFWSFARGAGYRQLTRDWPFGKFHNHTRFKRGSTIVDLTIELRYGYEDKEKIFCVDDTYVGNIQEATRVLRSCME